MINKVDGKNKGHIFKDGIGRKYGIYVAFIVLFVGMSIARPNTFFTVSNQLNILRQISINGILAIGMTFVIISGGIDLSVGSILAYSAIVATSFAHPNTYPLFVPLMIALGYSLNKLTKMVPGTKK